MPRVYVLKNTRSISLCENSNHMDRFNIFSKKHCMLYLLEKNLSINNTNLSFECNKNEYQISMIPFYVKWLAGPLKSFKYIYIELKFVSPSNCRRLKTSNKRLPVQNLSSKAGHLSCTKKYPIFMHHYIYIYLLLIKPEVLKKWGTFSHARNSAAS